MRRDVRSHKNAKNPTTEKDIFTVPTQSETDDLTAYEEIENNAEDKREELEKNTFGEWSNDDEEVNDENVTPFPRPSVRP